MIMKMKQKNKEAMKEKQKSQQVCMEFQQHFIY